jgi:hypothetical protein
MHQMPVELGSHPPRIVFRAHGRLVRVTRSKIDGDIEA